MKKNVYLTLLSIFIIVITASSSYAYFNSKLDIKGSNENNLNVLNIQNGNEKITIDKEVSLEGINGRVLDMTLDIDASKAEEFEIKFAKNNEYETIIRYYSKRNTIEFDRSYSGKYGDILHKREMKVKDNDGKLRMRLVLDKYSAEIFANDGEQVMTSTFYTPLDAQDITLSSKGKSILSIEKHKIDI